jgi:hypothetical protein
MHKTLLPKHLARALEAGVEPLDVVQGHIKNLMVEWQDKKTLPPNWSGGYQDCLTDLYLMCYDVIFYKQDLEKKNGESS